MTVPAGHRESGNPPAGEIPATGAIDDQPPAEPGSSKPPWWQRHRRATVVAVIVAIVLVTVLTDLPQGTTRSSDIAAEHGVMTEVNGDLAPCALAVHQALGIWALRAAHRLTPTEQAPTPGLLTDDQAACSLTNEGIFDLANIDVPGTTAGKDLGQMVATALLWTTSDAVRTIGDVETLMRAPDDARVVRGLATEERQLAADRRTAIAQEQDADRALAVRLQPVDLTAVAAPR